MILVAVIWIQAFTGTNFDFSAYSSEMKKVLGISQVQLNYLAVASDMGKVFGWSSGLALMYFPLWTVLFLAAFMGLFGYGIQWLVICNVISLPYILVYACSQYKLLLFFPFSTPFEFNYMLLLQMNTYWPLPAISEDFISGFIFLLSLSLSLTRISVSDSWCSLFQYVVPGCYKDHLCYLLSTIFRNK